MVNGLSNVRATLSTPRADVPTDDSDINNSNFQLLITQYVLGTMLNAVSALAHLILTTNTQDSDYYYSLQTRELRIREEKEMLLKVIQSEHLVKPEFRLKCVGVQSLYT